MNIIINNTRIQEIENILSDYKINNINLSDYEINKIIKKYKNRLVNFNYLEKENLCINNFIKAYNILNKKLSGKYKITEITEEYIIAINRNKTNKYYLNQNIFFKENIKTKNKDLIKDLAKYLNINC